MLESVGVAASGRTSDEALRIVNEIVRMIVQEFVEDGRPLPEGPSDSVEVADFSRRAAYRCERAEDYGDQLSGIAFAD